jgi:hypothetical protein
MRAIRSIEAARQRHGRGLATRLCIAVTALVLLGLCSVAQAVEVPQVPPLLTGPTGPAGPTGERGSTGPAGSEASSFGKYTQAGSTGGLASGKQESGGWSANIHAPAGSAQQQAQGVASFPIPLKFHEEVVVNYRNETESLGSTAPCVGSADEPVVLPVGNFCAYRGGRLSGAKEKGAGVGSVDTNVQGLTAGTTGTEAPPFFASFSGEKIKVGEKTGLAGQGDDGLLIVFRTTTFSEATPESLVEEAGLNAIGSWAVAAK